MLVRPFYHPRRRQVLMFDWKRLNSSRLDSLLSVRPPTLSLLQVRRQLEYTIAATKGVTLAKPPGTFEAVKEIYRANGTGGLYTGFRLHFRESFCLVFATSSFKHFTVRDTSGTALYFLEYDGMRHLLGRSRTGEQGVTPSWLPIHSSLVPFICGSVSGVRFFPSFISRLEGSIK